MPALRPVTARRPPTLRSRVTNGRAMFVQGDGRSPWARRYRDIVELHVSDLGGRDILSESQLSLIRRASALECELEQMEGRLSSGELVDLDMFARATSHLRRVLETLGLERRSRDIQTLEQYVAQNYGDRDDGDRVEERASESPGADPAPSLAPAAETTMPELPTAAESPSSTGGLPS